MGQSWKQLQQMYGKFFTYQLFYSTITRWILTKNVSLKDNEMEMIFSKQEEEFKATTFVVNILKPPNKS